MKDKALKTFVLSKIIRDLKRKMIPQYMGIKIGSILRRFYRARRYTIPCPLKINGNFLVVYGLNVGSKLLSINFYLHG